MQKTQSTVFSSNFRDGLRHNIMGKKDDAKALLIEALQDEVESQQIEIDIILKAQKKNLDKIELLKSRI